MHLKTRHFNWIEFIIDSDLPSYSKYLCLYLSTFMNSKQDFAWPGLKKIEHETGLTRPTIIKYMNIAEQSGFMVIERGDRVTSNKYYAKMPNEVVKLVNHPLVKDVYQGSKSHNDKVVKDVYPNKQSNKQSNKQRESKKKNATSLPDDYWPNEEQLTKMHIDHPNVQLGTETKKFKNYYEAHGKTMKNWDACWRNWILKAAEYQEEKR